MPHKGLLTIFKEYDVVKELSNAYVIKRDDGSIGEMDKSRFTSSLEEVERLKVSRDNFRKYLKTLIKV